MIKSVHAKPREQSILVILWCFINFVILNYFIFYSFMNACFDSLVDQPPLTFLLVLWAIIIVDMILGYAKYMKQQRGSKLFSRFFSQQSNPTVKKTSAYVFCNFANDLRYPKPLPSEMQNVDNKQVSYFPPLWFVLDCLVFIMVVIGFLFSKKYPWTVYLPIASLLRIYEVVQFNDIMRVILQTSHVFTRIFIIVKIFYLLILMTQIMGCIFYAIDDYLIKVQYFGSLADNPNLYYQGDLLCFSSIYALPQQQRYIYAMYYASALVATVAYGDIIPKNPIQNFTVVFYLFLSTIISSWVIQQMVIVFRNDKDTYYQLLIKIKHLSVYLSNKKISNQSRVVNYLVNSYWSKFQNRPLKHRLTKQLFNDIITHSNLSRIMPSLLFKFGFDIMNQDYYPQGYVLIDNNDHLALANDSMITPTLVSVIISGQCREGFSGNMFAEGPSSSKVYGFEEFITKTKDINKFLKVKTSTAINAYSVEELKLVQHFKFIKEKNETIDLSNTIDCTLQIEVQFQKLKDLYMYSHLEQTKCLCCSQKGHNALICPQIHYISQISSILNTKKSQRKQFQRTNIKSQKIKPFHKKQKQQVQIDFLQQISNLFQSVVSTTMKRYDEHYFDLRIEFYTEWQDYHTIFNCENDCDSQYFHQRRHNENVIKSM